MQELRFTAHEYLKGSGPTTLLVVVRGIHTYLTAAEAQADADFAVARRVTVWDNRQGVLFLQTPAEPYTAAAASASASSLQFTRSNFHREQEWDYSVDTLSRAWLPARDAGGAEGSTGTSDSAFITDGAASPPPVVSLTDLRTKIATMAAELQAGEGIEGYAECLQGKILRERYNRADPLTPLQLVATLASGASAGTEVHKRKNEYRDPRYNRYWLSGPDKDRFQARIIDDDDQAVTGYDHALVTARPLPAGAYQVRYNSQHHRRFPCNYVPDDAYTGFTVTVTAPPDTVHEAFFDPVAIGAAVGADGRHGVLDPTAFTVASTAATIRRLDWAGGSVRLDLSAPVVLAGHELEFIRPDGSVGLRLDLGQATATGLADGGRRLTWAPCPQPWRAGDTLMLRLRSSGASIGAVSCTPAPPLTPTPTATPTAP